MKYGILLVFMETCETFAVVFSPLALNEKWNIFHLLLYEFIFNLKKLFSEYIICQTNKLN